MKASPSALLFLLIASVAAFPQQDDREIIGVVIPREQQEARNRVELSRSRSNYPVTPGDVYALTYRSAGREIAGDILVESDYTLNLNVFGRINGKGLTFPQLKARVESIITDAYPSSLPYLTLNSVGMFQVYSTGEVPQTKFITAWGLTRLSEVVLANFSSYSSIRQVEIVGGDGRKRSCDLFKALQQGILEEDPFVRPGDTIVVHRRGKEIELQGEVVRPGKYQILPGDGIQEVIEGYGGGFTIRADRTRVRHLKVGEDTPEATHLDLSGGFIETVELQDGDMLSVPSKLARLPVVVFEGAVIPLAASTLQRGAAEAPAAPAGTEVHDQFIHAFAEGDTLYDALLEVKDSIRPTADLAGSYLVRPSAGQTIPVDLESLLYRYAAENDLELMPGDRVVIPPQRYSSVVAVEGEPRPLNAVIKPRDRIIAAETLIPVAGGVYSPGTFPFVPGATYVHYLNLAGGINPEVNSGNKVIILDSAGKRLKRDHVIQPGDRIYVRTNDFLYNFNRYFPLISSSLAIFTATVTLVDYFQHIR